MKQLLITFAAFIQLFTLLCLLSTSPSIGWVIAYAIGIVETLIGWIMAMMITDKVLPVYPSLASSKSFEVVYPTYPPPPALHIDEAAILREAEEEVEQLLSQRA